MLSPLGEVQVWKTDCLQQLDPVGTIYPVHAFTQSTAMRPFVEKMTACEATAFAATFAATFAVAYDQALTAANSLLPDGSCLMPFRRVFLMLKV